MHRIYRRLRRPNKWSTEPATDGSDAELYATPLHTKDLSPDPQSASPLYNGCIPPEIRDQIFEYAMTELTKTDLRSQYPANTNYTRPGYTGRRMVTTALLLTCKRVYLETYHLPPVMKEHVFWHARSPATNRNLSLHEDRYFAFLEPWQRALAKEIHFFTQLYWLEQSFPRLAREGFMQGIERVKITVRRGDWWYNEHNAPLGINPAREDGEPLLMRRDMRNWAKVEWSEWSWGNAFRQMASLKELELELETSEDKVPELKKIVEWAKGWRFPMTKKREDGGEGEEEEGGGEKMWLCSDGKVNEWEWRGGNVFWSDTCPYCGGIMKCSTTEQDLQEECRKKEELKAKGLGPTLKVFNLKYKLTRVKDRR